MPSKFWGKGLSTSNSTHKGLTKYASYTETFHTCKETQWFTPHTPLHRKMCLSNMSACDKKEENVRRQKTGPTQESSKDRPWDYWQQRHREQPFQKGRVRRALEIRSPGWKRQREWRNDRLIYAFKAFGLCGEKRAGDMQNTKHISKTGIISSRKKQASKEI